jgi:DNA-binding response OmpR family regulator
MLENAPIEFEISNVPRLNDALKRLDADDVDVVISDLSLPDSQGIETFHRLYGTDPTVPIIVLSGWMMKHWRSKRWNRARRIIS